MEDDVIKTKKIIRYYGTRKSMFGNNVDMINETLYVSAPRFSKNNLSMIGHVYSF